ncbi:MAG: tRNA (adenosine(37)-N6)-threonylcarbamoyltransferase complex ATPase subunit type 1 TsaE [Candidatus Krumholzibacteriia bacterium]
MASTWTSRSEEETRALGERFGRRMRGGEVVLLCGDLGVGKTQFAKGVGRGLDVQGDIVSPSFTLAVHYEGRLPLVHYDLYRVMGERELEEMGFLEPEDPRAVSLVEWGDRTGPPRGAIRVDMRLDLDGVRHIEIRGLDFGDAT